MSEHDKLTFPLSNILIRLNHGERLNLPDLADEYQVSTRTPCNVI